MASGSKRKAERRVLLTSKRPLLAEKRWFPRSFFVVVCARYFSQLASSWGKQAADTCRNINTQTTIATAEWCQQEIDGQRHGTKSSSMRRPLLRKGTIWLQVSGLVAFNSSTQQDVKKCSSLDLLRCWPWLAHPHSSKRPSRVACLTSSQLLTPRVWRL